jgi:hypothetical protein
MVDVHLYGKLRCYAVDPRPDQEIVVRLEPRPGETVRTALERLGIPPDEVCHVFLNGALLSTRNSMAPWLHYQRVSEGKGLETPVRAGDRLGLFAHDMALLVV